MHVGASKGKGFVFLSLDKKPRLVMQTVGNAKTGSRCALEKRRGNSALPSVCGGARDDDGGGSVVFCYGVFLRINGVWPKYKV